MAVLKRISPSSAFKVGLLGYGIMGLVVGAFCSLIAVSASPLAHRAHMPFARVGVFAIIVCPIVYGIIGGIAATIGAAIYNLVADWVGGLEVDIG